MKSHNNPMHVLSSPRCGAKTRTGAPCQTPAVKGKRRCRMHGGNSPGAPKGNKNAFKLGIYTAKAIAAVARPHRAKAVHGTGRTTALRPWPQDATAPTA